MQPHCNDKPVKKQPLISVDLDGCLAKHFGKKFKDKKIKLKEGIFYGQNLADNET
jgi:hypothetical protein